ncbi:MAG TPA: histidine kinase [Actinoplanes sp.]
MVRATFDRPLTDLASAGLIAVAAAAGSAVAARVTPGSVPLGVPGYLLVVVASLALAVRRSQPLAALAVAAPCAAGYLAAGYAYGPVLIVVMIAVYNATRHAPLRPALWCAGAALALLLVHLLTSDRRLGWLGVVPVVAWVVVPAALGYVLRLRHEAARQARDDAVRRQVHDERLRVAQEVHDIVGHGLAAIKMQADVALHVMARQPGQAQQALEAISRTSGQALDELRATLAVVRRTDGGERTPAAGLGDLPALRLRMAEAGVRVDLHTSGEPGPAARVPAAVDLAGYRVVQESLTNVLRHGGSARADVTVRYEPGCVAITVQNPLTGPPASGTGSGIDGMRARVEALGGQFTAGPVAQGFEVHARLPTGRPA